MQIGLPATIVAEQIWTAMHEMAYNPAGTPTINPVTKTHDRRWRYIMLKGSSRSSKTISTIDCIDAFARYKLDKRITIWRDTKVDCRATIGIDTERHLRRTNRWKNGFTFNETKGVSKYYTQSTVELNGIEDDVKAHGLTQDVAWFNEPYKISKQIFDQIDQRTSDFIIIDWNPRDVQWLEDLEKDPRTIVLHSTFKDNPFCPPEQRNKILGYQPIGMCAAVENQLISLEEAKVYDVITNLSKLNEKVLRELIRCKQNEYLNSASEYNWQIYGLGTKAELPNRIFHWNEISDDAYNAIDTEIITGVDWGAVDPWGIVDIKYYDGGLYLRERNYTSENELRKAMTPTDWAQIEGEDDGIVSWMFAALGIPYDRVIVCDNNRQSKILALRNAGWEYAIAADKPPGSVIDGIDILNNLRVYFTSSSVNIRNEQEKYSREVDRYGIVLDKPLDKDNHTIDPTRYVALHLQLEGIITKI